MDLSKKDVLTISLVKDGDTSNRNVASPCEQKEDNSTVPNPDTDDLEDSPLVIDEEITDSIDTKRTPSTVDVSQKVSNVFFNYYYKGISFDSV